MHGPRAGEYAGCHGVPLSATECDVECDYSAAQEVQAAGRIHRLGQTKDIFITRYAFRDSIEQATATLHEKVKSGDIKVG